MSNLSLETLGANRLDQIKENLSDRLSSEGSNDPRKGTLKEEEKKSSNLEECWHAYYKDASLKE